MPCVQRVVVRLPSAGMSWTLVESMYADLCTTILSHLLRRLQRYACPWLLNVGLRNALALDIDSQQRH